MSTPKNATPLDPAAVESGTYCQVCWTHLVFVHNVVGGDRYWAHEDTKLISCPPGVSRNRVFRIPDPEYDAASVAVERRGTTLTAVVRRAFQALIIEDEAASREDAS